MSRFEMIEPEGLEEALDVMAREGLRRAGAKLPVATKIVGRADFLMRTAGSTAGDQAGS